MKITQAKIEKAVLRKEVSSRGGGVEISLTSLGFKGEKMSAYQNYLGGGLLGKVCSNDTIRRQSLITDEETAQKLDAIAVELRRYYHNLTNPEDQEWESQTFEQNQLMPVSGY